MSIADSYQLLSQRRRRGEPRGARTHSGRRCARRGLVPWNAESFAASTGVGAHAAALCTGALARALWTCMCRARSPPCRSIGARP